MRLCGRLGLPIALTAASLALVGAGIAPEDGEQKLRKTSKAPGSCGMVRLADGIVLHARPYAMERGAVYFAAHVHSISVLKNGKSIAPISKEEAAEPLYGSFQGKMVAKGLKVVFPVEALGPESEVVVRYYGAGFVGDKKDDGEVSFRFDPKSLR